MASMDGERIAAIVKTEDDSYTVCVNGETWSNTFEEVVVSAIRSGRSAHVYWHER